MSTQRDMTSTADLIDPGHSALIVIDYQKDFVSEGGALHKAGLHSPRLAEIHGELSALIETARAAGTLVVFVRCHYDRDLYMSEAFLRQAGRSFRGMYVDVPVCEAGTWGAEFVDGIEPIPGDIVVTKHRFSAFAGTDLDMVLRRHGVKTMVVCGVVTHVCVESTVRDGFFNDYHCVIPREATAGWHQEWHENSLAVMDWGFGNVLGIDEVLDTWRGADVPQEKELQDEATA